VLEAASVLVAFYGESLVTGAWQLAADGSEYLRHGEGAINGWLDVGAGLAGWLAADKACAKDVGGTLFCCVPWRP
jgi:hypothetical protein